MPTNALFTTLIVLAVGVLAVLAGSVYPFVSVVRTSRALPSLWRWLWALSTIFPGLVCVALMPSRQFVALGLNWLVWLFFLWRARALTWRVARPWKTGILAAIALLAAGYVSFGLWGQHDSKAHTSLISEPTVSS